MYLCIRNPLLVRPVIMTWSFLALATAAFAQDPGPVSRVPKSDPAMAAAFVHAAAGLDGFFAKYRNPPPGSEGYSVKIGLFDTSNPPGYVLVRPGDETPKFVEWFWTDGLTIERDGFSAPLGNDPDTLRNVKRGQVIHFTREYIGDRMYLQNGKIVGNATVCPALVHGPEADRQLMKERFGLVCD
jgi:uncharacterized protein YegJ (DUF2314 family)